MKKLLLIGAVLMAMQSLRAQTSWLLTGNTTTGTEKFGSISGNFDLNFHIANVLRWSFKTTGDLDIITTGAGLKLAGNRMFWQGSAGTWNNVFIGYWSGNSNTTGQMNTAVGAEALQFTTSGNDNSAVGGLALNANTTGYANSAFGAYALANNTSGAMNTAVGYDAAIQQQQKKIDALDSVNKVLQNQINSCCQSANRSSQSGSGNSLGNTTTTNGGLNTTSSINVELTNLDVAVLNPAAPNPFAEQTVITFYIPSNAENAQVLFYDYNGKLIKTVDVSKRGKGQMYVFGNDLSSGTYSYTLVVDGKIIDTKKMVKQ